MPVVTLSEEYDGKLKSLVTEPFEQTRESIVEDLIDAEVARRSAPLNGNGILANHDSIKEDALRIDPGSHESLTHTRLLSATIDSREISRPKWNSIRSRLHVMALERLGSFETLQSVSSANLRKGKYEKDGYKYLPEAGLSIQGVAAEVAWRHSLALAKAIKVPIRITLEWRNKKGAAHPGERGLLEWLPEEG